MKAIPQFLDRGGNYVVLRWGEEEHEGDPVLGPLSCCSSLRHLDIRHWCPMMMRSLLLGSTSASLGPPALCALSVPHSWAHQKHVPESTPLQVMGIPPGHPETFCCSWQFHEAASGPSAWVLPIGQLPFPLHYLLWCKEVQAPPTSLAAPGAQGLSLLGS